MSDTTKTKKAKEVKPVPMELTELKNGIKGIEQGIKRIEEVGKQVSELKDQAETFLENNELVNKDNYPEASRLVSLLRTTRTSLDSERKTAVAPLNNAVKYYNSLYNENIESIKEAEAKIKPLKDVYDKEEEDRKEKAKQEKEKVFVERIQVLTDLGAQLLDGWYVIKSPDGDEGKDISYQAAELRSISDENWEKAKKLAQKYKDELAGKAAKEAKEAEEKEAKRLADERKLKADQEQMLNDRMEVRAQKFELMGFVEESGYFLNGRIKHKIDEIKVMENDEFKELESSLKITIAEAKKQEEIDQRVSSIIQLGFVASGNGFVFVRDDFNFKISKDSTLDATAIESAIAEFKEAKSDYDKKQSVLLERKTGLLNIGFKYHSGTIYFKEIGTLSRRIDIASDNYVSELESIEKAVEEYAIEQQNIADKKKKCSDLLNQAGMRYDYAKEIFSYNFKTPDDKGVTESISISMDEVLGKSEQDLSKYVENFIAQVDMDNSAKIEYDNKIAKEKEIEEANKKTDAQNIEAFVSKVKELVETVIIKDETTRGKLQMQVDLFINEVEKM